MADLVTVLIGFPTVLFTVPFGVALLYWIFVVFGALDFHHADADSALEGATKGALEGVAKGAADGALEGAAKGAADGALEGAGKGVAEEVFAGLSSALHLRDAPVTVVLTLFVTFGFLVSALAMQTLGPRFGDGPLVGTLVLVAASFVSLLFTSIVVRPLAPLFRTHAAKGRRDLVGRVCVISTGHVDARFGQATLEDGGAGLILQVRCETEVSLRRGDRALILGWDAKSEGFVVEPMDMVLPRVAAQDDAYESENELETESEAEGRMRAS